MNKSKNYSSHSDNKHLHISVKINNIFTLSISHVDNIKSQMAIITNDEFQTYKFNLILGSLDSLVN